MGTGYSHFPGVKTDERFHAAITAFGPGRGSSKTSNTILSYSFSENVLSPTKASTSGSELISC